MSNKINNISSDTVKKATGKTWDSWILLLDKEGADKMNHTAIAKMLSEKGYIKSGWWCQMVTVGYEYAKGKRVVGQTEKTNIRFHQENLESAKIRELMRKHWQQVLEKLSNNL